MAIPVVGRLTFADYQRIFVTFLILLLEFFLRAIIYLIPVSFLDWARFRVIGYSLSFCILLTCFLLPGSSRGSSEGSVTRISKRIGVLLLDYDTLWT